MLTLISRERPAARGLVPRFHASDEARVYTPLMKLTAIVVLLLSASAGAATVRIVQTNSAGDNIHLIDPATNTVVAEITGVEVNHGAAVTPDGSRFFFSDEAEHTLDAVDGKTLAVIKRIALSGRPNNISISKDGRHVYVAIVSPPGAVDVVDSSALNRVKTIGVDGGVHNTFVTPDGRMLWVNSKMNSRVYAYTLPELKLIGAVKVGDDPDWLTFTPDSRRVYVANAGSNSVSVIDTATIKEVTRIPVGQVPKRNITAVLP